MRGNNICVAAVAIGAKIIEKHFTLDRSQEGNDHKVSLLPKELEALVNTVRDVEEAMGSKTKQPLSQGQLMNKEILGKSLCKQGYKDWRTILRRPMYKESRNGSSA